MTKYQSLVIGIMSIYTIIIVYGIHKYEARIKEYKDSISDYKRALGLSRMSQNDPQILYLLDEQNKVLQRQIHKLQAENTELRSGIHTGFPSPHIEQGNI